MIRVLIIDDHSITRAGIRSLLAQAPDIDVVAEAGDGEEGVGLALQKRPDVIVLDISLPEQSGMEVLKKLKNVLPRTAILVLSMHPEDQYAIPLLRAGASGYVAKKAPAETLLHALRRVHSGGRFISEAVAAQLALGLDPGFDGPAHNRLSGREFEVLRLLAGGRTITDIGSELGLSVKTVSTYRRRILDKMNLSSTAEIIRYAYENRLVE